MHESILCFLVQINDISNACYVLILALAHLAPHIFGAWTSIICVLIELCLDVFFFLCVKTLKKYIKNGIE